MQITDTAKEFIEALLQEHNFENIRVLSAGQGCCGPQIGLAVDEPQDDDVVIVINGIKVAIENRVVSYTKNIILDFQENSAGSGLVIAGNSC